ncbi:MAG: hypothetical protein LBG27_06880 [Spirochaetaceae bacterium]|jgi:hypothetical protein|nr:hypothetical protein [Spirochaetaceae bacterium]
MAIWLGKIQKKNPQDTRSKWCLMPESVGIKDITKEIEGQKRHRFNCFIKPVKRSVR